jgi:superfamily II DNA/RNA helicase
VYETQAVRFAELGLPVPLVQALRRDGLDTAFPIQAAVIPDILAGRDVLGRAATGSGKTLAFGLPLLVRLTRAPAAPRRPRGLVLAPTRELALQIERALDEAALSLGLRLGTAVGGVPIKRQAERLARGVDLLIATPGRLSDLVAQGAAALDAVRVIAIDEADHMAELGFAEQVAALLGRIPGDAQHLLFSATLDDAVDTLVHRYLRDPVTHAVDTTIRAGSPSAARGSAPDVRAGSAPGSRSTSAQRKPERSRNRPRPGSSSPLADAASDPAEVTGVDAGPAIAHHLLQVRKTEKFAVVAEMAARGGRTLLFVRTQYGADKLARRLRESGVAAAALHGGRSQAQRTRTLAAFADGSAPVLVATDVAARGIHVDGVSLVVHADPPADPKDYLHRAGRTARAGETGTVVTVVTGDESPEFEDLIRRAGVHLTISRVHPGDRHLAALTGARRPSGRPLADPTAAPPAEPPARDTPHDRRRPGTRQSPPPRTRHRSAR